MDASGGTMPAAGDTTGMYYNTDPTYATGAYPAGTYPAGDGNAPDATWGATTATGGGPTSFGAAAGPPCEGAPNGSWERARTMASTLSRRDVNTIAFSSGMERSKAACSRRT